MLTPDVRFEAWTTQSWSRFVDLWKPRAEPEREATRVRGGVIAIESAGAEGRPARLLKLLHTKHGRLEIDRPWPAALSELVPECGGSWGLRARREALDDIMEEFGARTRRHHDLVAQSLTIVNIVREKMIAGTIEFWPQRLQGIPVPTEAMVYRSIDSICADGKCILLGLFDHGDLWTALCARRRGMAFDVVAGPEDLRLGMGLLSGDWRRDVRHLVKTAEEMYGPLSMGCFAEVSRFRELQVDPQPGAWGRAVLVRDIVLSPTPAAVGLALGYDGARFALEGLRAFSERSEALKKMEPLLRGVRQRVGTALGDKDVATALGFNPLEVLRALLRR
ncbi:MAG: hypothetical protein U0174_14330 [Polyangiaceae bacterium]